MEIIIVIVHHESAIVTQNRPPRKAIAHEKPLVFHNQFTKTLEVVIPVDSEAIKFGSGYRVYAICKVHLIRKVYQFTALHEDYPYSRR